MYEIKKSDWKQNFCCTESCSINRQKFFTEGILLPEFELIKEINSVIDRKLYHIK